MSRVHFISDLHLGHKNIMKFAGHYRSWCSNLEEHDELLVERIAKKLNKRDTLYILGDVCFDLYKYHLIDRIPATKYLVRGNHDDKAPAEDHLKYFTDILGIKKYKKSWLTHAPIHPKELRNKINIHGHVHQNDLFEEGYVNVCVEACDGEPVNYQDIVSGYYKEKYTERLKYLMKTEEKEGG